jgi:hypothetical protein
MLEYVYDPKERVLRRKYVGSWRVANSLITLLSQVNALYPGRNKASDGTIGDAAHQAQQSDHNPDASGIVRALDLTNDPSHGFDIDAFTDALQLGRDDRVSYVIANRLIMFGNRGPVPWVWQDYDGDDPHTGHVHISVTDSTRADSPVSWVLPGLTGGAELVATTNEKIDAMMMGFPSTPDGDPVCPTRWQIATEKWQVKADAQLKELRDLIVAGQQMPPLDYQALARELLLQLASKPSTEG